MQSRKSAPTHPATSSAPAVPIRRERIPAAADSLAEDAAPQAAADAEFEAFVAFQNVGAENSSRALRGRRGTR